MSRPDDMFRTMRIHLPPKAEVSLHERQWEKIKKLFYRITTTENFNSRRLREAGLAEPLVKITNLDEFRQHVPLCSKADIVADHLEHPPFGSNLTEPLINYTRFCQTSGTGTGHPMAWLDTPASWEAMIACWRKVLKFAGVGPGDRVMFAFSFGPFLGFWTAFEAAARDSLVLPGGGLSSQARLEVMARYGATVLCCTPTYAMRLGETIGAPSGIGLDALKVRKVILAGEPGGSMPTTRDRLKELWGGAKIFDHHGMTEAGPISYENPEFPACLCVMQDAYFAEIIDAEGKEVEDGEEGELVITTLDRISSPLLRYRTGDWVCKKMEGDDLYLEGGILTRTDDMVFIRGVNVYPSAVENIIRRHPEVLEFMVEQSGKTHMEELTVTVELNPGQADAEEIVHKLEDRLRDTFLLRIPVKIASNGSLPRFEFKAKRWKKVD